MSAKASGTFETRTWEETPYEETGDGGKLTRVKTEQVFQGGVEGEAKTEFLMCYCKNGTGSFVGFHHVTARIAGRSGSFVLQSNGTFEGESAGAKWFVVPGSAAGGLTGLLGQGGFPPHHGRTVPYTLEYDLD